MLICADSRAALAEMEVGSVQCCITSPPYWGLRSYGGPDAVFGGDAGCEHVWGGRTAINRDRQHLKELGERLGCLGGNKHSASAEKYGSKSGQFCQLCEAWKGQLGLEPTPELYVDHLMEYLRAIWRVLRDDGTLWLNLGDSYFGGRSTGRQPKDAKGAEQARQTKSDWKTCQYCGVEFLGYPTQRFCSDACGGVDNTPRQVRFGMKPKDLVMIPFRVALAAQADGWWVRSVIIWSKPNPMPESVRDRPTTAHEYVFLLTKSARYFYDADAIREPAVNDRLPGWNMTDTRETHGPMSGGNQGLVDLRRSYHTDGLPSSRNKRTVWEIATAPYPGAHYATFPPKLVEPMILTTPTKVCAQCGAGWERVTKQSGGNWQQRREHGAEMRAGDSPVYQNAIHGEGMSHDLDPPTMTTLGFRPTCSCDAESKPAVILDPFCGRGTVLKEARAHGRDWIGIDVDPQSIRLAEEWLGLGPVEYETPEESWIQPRLTITEPG